MDYTQVDALIRGILSDFCPFDRDDVSMLTSFDELGIDSMSVMDLLEKVEKEFGVEIPDAQLPKIANGADLVGFVAAATGSARMGVEDREVAS